MLDIKVDMIKFYTDNIIINNLFNKEEYYISNYTDVDYEWFPLSYTDGYNLNLFARGFTIASGANLPRIPNQSVSGWSKYLPSHYFGN